MKLIGHSARSIRAMGDKNSSRQQGRKGGVPVTAGSDGTVDTEQQALKIAKKIGYPVMIKAVAGGGGRGMRPAHKHGSLVQGFHAAPTEAENAFRNSGLYIEQLILRPHHHEVQVIGGSHGRMI